MESNWRFNVWNLGLWQSGIKLITRWATVAGVNYYVGEYEFPQPGFPLLSAAPGQVPVVYQLQPKAGRPFPYGFATAEPDH